MAQQLQSNSGSLPFRRVSSCMRQNSKLSQDKYEHTFILSLTILPMHISDFKWHKRYAFNFKSLTFYAHLAIAVFFFLLVLAAHQMDTLYTMNHKSLAQAHQCHAITFIIFPK